MVWLGSWAICPKALLGAFLMVCLPTLDIRFSFSMQISYVQFVLNLSGSASEGFGGLWQSLFPTTVHVFFSTSSLCLHCVHCVLKPEQGRFSHEGAVLPLYGLLLQPHAVPSRRVIANNPWFLSHQSLAGSSAIRA